MGLRAGDRPQRRGTVVTAPADAAELEDIADRLGGARKTPGGWTCRCPAHDDGKASLSLGLGEDGRLLWHCHAGCPQGAVLEALMERGLVLNSAAQGSRAQPGKRRAGGRIIAAYRYVDEQGDLLFEVVRYEPKDFRQRRPDGGGGWTWRLDGTRRVLFRLPQVLAADAVIFVEGEKDALNLAAAGLCGTTSPQGAKFWRDELAAPLKGKRVTVLPDNDPVGREHAHRVAAAAGRHGAIGVKVVELGGLAAHGDVSDWLRAGHTADELREVIAEAPEWEPTRGENPDDDEQAEAAIRETEAGPDPERVIRLAGGELHLVVAAAAAALGRAGRADPFRAFYRRGNMLVRATRLADAAELRRAGVHRTAGALVIAAADPDALRVALTAAAGWKKFDARRKKWTSADAPLAVAKALLATAELWADIPILTGIVEAPTLRPDGSVLDLPGYDHATGLLFDPGGLEFPRVPESPTKRQAEAALAKINTLLEKFPFVDGSSRTTAVSGIVTPRVRKACRAVPLHAYTAPKMASGKTLLATLPGYVGTGRAPAMMSQADDPTDERKRILAVLLEGQETSVIDNAERELRSDALCTVLTEPQFSDRLLGVSRTVTAPSASTWFVTGNNLALAGDLTARAVSCALDPAVERPEEREFEVDLHKVVPERRAELAVAALTIVRAYLAAGEPDVGVPNFARFEDWSRLVRRPLVWLGMEDPCKGRERVEGRDPVRAQLGALLEAWRENYPGEAATVAEAVRLATRDPAPGEADADIEARGRLRDVMTELAGGGKNGISPGSVGKFIAKHEGRIEGGLRFRRRGETHKVARWAVDGIGGVDGFGGFASKPTRETSETTHP